MIPTKMISSLLLASFCTLCLAEYGSDYDNSYNGGYRVEPERHEYEEPQYHESPMERSHSPSSESNSYHLFHKDNPQADHSHQQQDQPQHHHEQPKHHNHDHGTSSMSFYQKVKHHEHKFKFEQKHGKHGNFHGHAHPYAYGGLKVHDW